jgi:hypothetical protein
MDFKPGNATEGDTYMLKSIKVSRGQMGAICWGMGLYVTSGPKEVGRSEKAGIGPELTTTAGEPSVEGVVVVVVVDVEGKTCFITNCMATKTAMLCTMDRIVYKSVVSGALGKRGWYTHSRHAISLSGGRRRLRCSCWRCCWHVDCGFSDFYVVDVRTTFRPPRVGWKVVVGRKKAHPCIDLAIRGCFPAVRRGCPREQTNSTNSLAKANLNNDASCKGPIKPHTCGVPDSAIW